MFEGLGAFGVVLGIGGSFFALAGITMIVVLVRRLNRHKRIMATGLTAEARCLDVYTSTRTSSATDTSSASSSTTRHAILGFTAHDGREVRFDETSPGRVVVGDIVPVRYLAERPERAVMVGPLAGRRGGGCAVAFAVVFLLVFTCFGLVIAAGGFGFADVLFGLGSSTGSDPTFTDPSFTAP